MIINLRAAKKMNVYMHYQKVEMFIPGAMMGVVSYIQIDQY